MSPQDTGNTKRFLDVLFSGKEDTEYILVWLLVSKRSYWFKDTAAAAAFIEENKNRDTYIGVALSPKDHGPDQRLKIEGGERMPSSLVALWADLDILNPAHKKKNLPPDEAAVMGTLFPDMPPTMLVHSGGGLQAWWVFKEPWILDTPAEVERAAALAKRWIRAIRANAAAKGFDVDQVGDMTRVMRCPGTTNCKIPGQPRPCVLRTVTDRRYNPSDLEEYLDLIGAARTEAPRARGIVVGQLTYDPTVQVDPTRFGLVAAAEPKFGMSWNHKRSPREFPDQSASSYDQALANFAAQAGWPDQEIANLLIAHRRMYGCDLKLRDSYYVTTIRKARELAGSVEVWKGVDEVIALQEARDAAVTEEAAQSAVNPQTAPKQREIATAQEAMTTLDHVSEILGIKITQIYKYLGEQPSYRLKCDKGEMGEIDMGDVKSLTVQAVFRDHVAALTNYRIPTFKAPEWDKVSRLLLSSITAVRLGPEAKLDGLIKSWLDQYFEGVAILDSIEQADQTKSPFRSATFSDCVCFYLASFQRWSTTNHGADRIATTQLLRALKRIGVEPVTHHCGESTRSVYRMQEGYEPPRPVRAGIGAEVVKELLETKKATDEPEWVTEDQSVDSSSIESK